MRIILAFLLASATTAWAGPVEELAACQVQVGTLTMQTRQAEQGRDAYVLQLGKTLAELHEQLDQARQQLQALTQEVQRLKAPKPDEKK
jgi:TolA-binding protein